MIVRSLAKRPSPMVTRARQSGFVLVVMADSAACFLKEYDQS
jgi:hypothetical protein